MMTRFYIFLNEEKLCLRCGRCVDSLLQRGSGGAGGMFSLHCFSVTRCLTHMELPSQRLLRGGLMSVTYVVSG